MVTNTPSCPSVCWRVDEWSSNAGLIPSNTLQQVSVRTVHGCRTHRPREYFGLIMHVLRVLVRKLVKRNRQPAVEIAHLVTHGRAVPLEVKAWTRMADSKMGASSVKGGRSVSFTQRLGAYPWELCFVRGTE